MGKAKQSRPGRGSSIGRRHKGGTKDKDLAKSRDELAARAEAADRAAAAELLADLATEEQPQATSPQTVTKRQPLAAGQRARWRSMIIWKYVELGAAALQRRRGKAMVVPLP
jgi:16S rRNA U1498 N3-methylase RsmE